MRRLFCNELEGQLIIFEIVLHVFGLLYSSVHLAERLSLCYFRQMGEFDLNRNGQDLVLEPNIHVPKMAFIFSSNWWNLKRRHSNFRGLGVASQGWGCSFPPWLWLPSLSAETILVLSCSWPYLEISPMVLPYKELFILQGAGREERGQTGRKWQGSSQQQEVALLVSPLFTLNLACCESSLAWLPAAQSTRPSPGACDTWRFWRRLRGCAAVTQQSRL